MFAPFALTPVSVYPTGQDIPSNVPNTYYQPDLTFKADRMTDWFDSRDSANLAVVHLHGHLPDGAVMLKVYGEADCPQGSDTQTFNLVLPSVPTLPLKPVV